MQELALFSGHQTQLIRNGGKYPYPLTLLYTPGILSIFFDIYDYKMAPEVPWVELQCDNLKSGATGA